jgi:3-deoxy-D-manno-octulosonic-acid transferase
VGEAASGLAVLEAFPEAGYTGPKLMTVGTPAGLSVASHKIWPNEEIYDFQFPNHQLNSGYITDIQLAAPPLDFWGAPQRFLDRVDPIALVIIETEIWPELVYQCARRHIPLIIVSGRLSLNSFERYLKIRHFMGPILRFFDLISAIDISDRERFVALGSDNDRTIIGGSPKFDRLIAKASNYIAQIEKNNSLESQTNNSPIILAGSTHHGEEAIILKAVNSLDNNNIRLILSPRHIPRVKEVADTAKSLGFQTILYSQTNNLTAPWVPKSVVIVDRVGVLADLYAQADIAVVGGSFLGGTGHNPLEPAAYGRPTVFGLYMDSFLNEAQDLRALGAASVAAPENLATVLSRLLADPLEARANGLRGAQYLASLSPIAPLLAKTVLETLESSNQKSRSINY